MLCFTHLKMLGLASHWINKWFAELLQYLFYVFDIFFFYKWRSPSAPPATFFWCHYRSQLCKNNIATSLNIKYSFNHFNGQLSKTKNTWISHLKSTRRVQMEWCTIFSSVTALGKTTRLNREHSDFGLLQHGALSLVSSDSLSFFF